MNTYHVFWNKKVVEVKAATSLEAQTKGAALHKVKKAWFVHVVLVAKGEANEPVVHSTSSIG